MAERVALVGALGHGLWHRRVIERLRAAGRVEPVAFCDRQPLTDAEDAPLRDVPVFDDHRRMLAATRPDVVVVCTPPHTHLPIALDVVHSGADLLLEKPPLASLAEHRRLTAELRTTGRTAQVGFQALGSHALQRLSAAIADGELGDLSRLGAVGAWWRPDAYFTRAPWAGKRFLDGRPVIDGALVNPFAHALMQALVLAGPAATAPMRLELERYRSRAIETDDTTFARVTFASGVELVVAVTLDSSVFLPGEIVVTGHRRTAVLEYPTDRLQLPGDDEPVHVPGRDGLLENLLDHRADPAVALIAPLSRTAVFTTLLEAIVSAPEPARIPARHLRPHPDGGGSAVEGIDRLVRKVVTRHRLPSELNVSWAAAPHRVVLDRWRPIVGSESRAG
ncbi:oxidoreductase [Virgisporangium aliadipatigenens]|uniref:Oxidoreductase n=1 Tax=Virgisporangium aliadipatigenens TaxID=741659 RepID=A0A8J3YME7_9ACTN|nr:Gfo/Idh/MocA family oxidoreductase [Virgisporangium aliadipatigenens]GIJ46545.1 oxidoreductase [Virgisporangium aliadipatigenens]